jgi:4'-phosphopantetheinyl transferase
MSRAGLSGPCGVNGSSSNAPLNCAGVLGFLMTVQRAFGFRIGAVQVDCVALDVPSNEIARLAASLSQDEQRRAARLRVENDRLRWIVTRARLRELIAERLDIEPQEVAFAYGPLGKPMLADPACAWRFSVSRSNDLAMYAFSRHCEVGIDVECVQAVPEADRIVALCFSERERTRYAGLPPAHRPFEFARTWTRKEAVAKALGDGLHARLVQLDGALPASSFCPREGFLAAVASTQ